MAIITSLYNHTLKLFANGEVSLPDFKFMLLDGTAVFDATDTDIDDVSGGGGPPAAKEVSGSGWDVGGVALTSVAVTTTGTNDAKLDADDISVTATGGAIGPTEYGVIYDSDSGKPLAFLDFDGEKAAGESTDFKVLWHANGVITWTI